MIHKKVRFKDQIYWLHVNVVGGCNLSPLHHYSENGELLVDPFEEYSFALVIDGNIERFGELIGSESELEDV